MAWIGKCIDSKHHEPCEFSKEHYVGDGRAKGVDARANARVWLRLWARLLCIFFCNHNYQGGIDEYVYKALILGNKQLLSNMIDREAT